MRELTDAEMDCPERPTDTAKEIDEMIAKKEAKDRKEADTKARVRASLFSDALFGRWPAFFAKHSLSPSAGEGHIRNRTRFFGSFF